MRERTLSALLIVPVVVLAIAAGGVGIGILVLVLADPGGAARPSACCPSPDARSSATGSSRGRAVLVAAAAIPAILGSHLLGQPRGGPRSRIPRRAPSTASP